MPWTIRAELQRLKRDSDRFVAPIHDATAAAPQMSESVAVEDTAPELPRPQTGRSHKGLVVAVAAAEQKASAEPPRNRRLLAAGLVAAAIGVLVAGFLFLRLIGKSYRASPGVGHWVAEQRVTANPPETPVRDAVVSHDGKYIAYADTTGLYRRQISTGETHQWPLPKGFVAWPDSWFPDGTHLLVVRPEGGRAARKSSKLAGFVTRNAEGQ